MMVLENYTGLHIHDHTNQRTMLILYILVTKRSLQIKMVMGSTDTSQNRTINVNFSAHLTHLSWAPLPFSLPLK